MELICFHTPHEETEGEEVVLHVCRGEVIHLILMSDTHTYLYKTGEA